jgi:DNA-directed RNA polymerase specialized sigma24 family protein
MSPEELTGQTAPELALRSGDQEAQLEAAKQAATQGQPLQMLEFLYKSHALDGLVRRLQSKWSRLPSADIDMAVAKAVDAAYDFLRSGKTIPGLVGFLWKVADRRAFDYSRLLRSEIATDPKIIADVAHPNAGIPGEEPDSGEDERGAMIQRAVKIARKLLPRLGQETIRRVMSLVVDAAEEGLEDLPNRHIAELLDLSVDTVKQSKSRGFERLKRLAKEEGLIGETEITSLGSSTFSDLTDEEEEET